MSVLATTAYKNSKFGLIILLRLRNVHKRVYGQKSNSPASCLKSPQYRRNRSMAKQRQIHKPVLVFRCIPGGVKSNYNGEDMKLLRRLKEYKREHLRFLSDFQVPFDNNLAERDLRMIKSKTKVSGCFRGIDGGTVFANIKSYTSTLKKNSRNIFDGLKAAFLNAPFSWA